MATLTKTESGKWKALVRKKGHPTQVKTFRLKRDAKDWATRVEDELRRGIYIPHSKNQSMTLLEAMNRYLHECSKEKAPGTHQSNLSCSKSLINSLGSYSMLALTQDKIAAYRDERLQTISQRTQRKISADTVRLELALLSEVFSYLLEKKEIELSYNPVFFVKKPKPKSRSRRLSPEEEDYLISACKQHSNPMLAWIAELAIATAMRYSEIVTLEEDQINFQNRTILLTKTKNGSERTVPLSLKAAALLKEAVNCPLRKESHLLFPGNTGKDGTRKPIIINRTWRFAIQRAIKNYQHDCIEKGIKPNPRFLQNFRFHDQRHEGISRLAEKRFSDQEIMAISGHKTHQMVAKYTHLRAEDLVNKLD